MRKNQVYGGLLLLFALFFSGCAHQPERAKKPDYSITFNQFNLRTCPKEALRAWPDCKKVDLIGLTNLPENTLLTYTIKRRYEVRDYGTFRSVQADARDTHIENGKILLRWNHSDREHILSDEMQYSGFANMGGRSAILSANKNLDLTLCINPDRTAKLIDPKTGDVVDARQPKEIQLYKNGKCWDVALPLAPIMAAIKK